MEINVKRTLNFYDAYFEDEQFYVSSNNNNGIYKIDMKSFETELVAKFDDTLLCEDASYGKIIKFKNKIFCFPLFNTQRNISTVDLSNKKTRNIALPNQKEARRRIFEYVENGIEIWLICRALEYPLLIFNLETGQLNVRSQWNEDIKKTEKIVDNNLLFKKIIKIGDSIWFAMKKTSNLVETDIESREITIHKIKEEEVELESIAFDGTKFWFSLHRKKEIASWDMVSNNFFKYKIKCKNDISDIDIYSGIVCTNNRVFAVPTTGAPICVLDEDASEFVEFGESLKDLYFSSGIVPYLKKNKQIGLETTSFNYRCYVIKKDKLFLLPSSENLMIIVNTKTLTVKTKEIFFNYDKRFEEALYPQVISIAKSQGIQEGEKNFSLGSYLSATEKDSNNNPIRNVARVKNGIYGSIKLLI